MTTKTKARAELKRIAYSALLLEYGFAPAMSNIILLEADGDGTYIRFMVKSHEYRFDVLSNGNNTITKES